MAPKVHPNDDPTTGTGTGTDSGTSTSTQDPTAMVATDLVTTDLSAVEDDQEASSVAAPAG
jgi:hypothetical protein